MRSKKTTLYRVVQTTLITILIIGMATSLLFIKNSKERKSGLIESNALPVYSTAKIQTVL